MPTITLVKIPKIKQKSYPVLIDENLFECLGNWTLLKRNNYEQIVIITDKLVKKLYGFTLKQNLIKSRFKVILISFDLGEEYKNNFTKEYIEHKMFKIGCNRNTLCIALGGGVVGDVAGFVASTYMRGIDIIQIPTTLLAMVDSSIGGKTAINTKYGKNLIGTFWQPKAVIVNIDCLITLSKLQLIEGLLEAIKIFLALDANSFIYLTNHLDKIIAGDKNKLKVIIFRAIKLKAKIIAEDEKEYGKRVILNFGHTIGHAIEKVSNYKIKHGIAVGLGILVEVKISELLGVADENCYNRIADIFYKLEIQKQILKNFMVEEIIKAIKLDKKNKKKKPYCILLKNIGAVYNNSNKFAYEITEDIIRVAYNAII